MKEKCDEQTVHRKFKRHHEWTTKNTFILEVNKKKKKMARCCHLVVDHVQNDRFYLFIFFLINFLHPIRWI